MVGLTIEEEVAQQSQICNCVLYGLLRNVYETTSPTVQIYRMETANGTTKTIVSNIMLHPMYCSDIAQRIRFVLRPIIHACKY